MRGRKKTMLLTVIAVATLLVAVVGATFAYFSLSVSGEATATQAAVKTPSASTVTLTGSNKNLHLQVNAVDMAQSGQGVYYAISEDDEKYNVMKDSGSIHGDRDEEKKYEIAKVVLSNAAEKTEYTCGYKVTISSAINLSTLTKGDLVLKLEGPGIGDVSGDTKEVDLSELTGEETTVEATGNFKLNSSKLSDVVKASLSLKNSEDPNQATTLANKDLTITITTAGNGECTVAAAAN